MVTGTQQQGKGMKVPTMKRVMLEQMLYNAADHFIVDYNGGSSEWHEKPGVWVLQPPDEVVKVHNTNNYSDGEYTKEQISYGMAILVANRRCWRLAEAGEDTESWWWATHQYKIRDHFLAHHKEKDNAKLLSFID